MRPENYWPPAADTDLPRIVPAKYSPRRYSPEHYPANDNRRINIDAIFHGIAVYTLMFIFAGIVALTVFNVGRYVAKEPVVVASTIDGR